MSKQYPLKLIGITEELKQILDKKKLYPRETYDDILRRLLNVDKLKIKNVNI